MADQTLRVAVSPAALLAVDELAAALAMSRPAAAAWWLETSAAEVRGFVNDMRMLRERRRGAVQDSQHVPRSATNPTNGINTA